jgi:hypothetical protein
MSLLCVAGLSAAMPAAAKDKPAKRHSKAEAEQITFVTAEPHRAGALGFSADELRIVDSYMQRQPALCGKHPQPLPPGLAKKVARGGKLPPGWEKKCVPGERMPLEVYERCHPLPPQLVVRLPAPPDSTITVAVDGKIVRLVRATLEILDVFNVNVRL